MIGTLSLLALGRACHPAAHGPLGSVSAVAYGVQEVPSKMQWNELVGAPLAEAERCLDNTVPMGGGRLLEPGVDRAPTVPSFDGGDPALLFLRVGSDRGTDVYLFVTPTLFHSRRGQYANMCILGILQEGPWSAP